MKKKPEKPIINFGHPLSKGLVIVELFNKPMKWLHTWRRVCIIDEAGKTKVYLDGNLYLYYGVKLKWYQKLWLRYRPFCLLRQFRENRK